MRKLTNECRDILSNRQIERCCSIALRFLSINAPQQHWVSLGVDAVLLLFNLEWL